VAPARGAGDSTAYPPELTVKAAETNLQPCARSGLVEQLRLFGSKARLGLIPTYLQLGGLYQMGEV